MYSSVKNRMQCLNSQAGLATRRPLPPITLLFQHLDRVPSPESDLIRVLLIDAIKSVKVTIVYLDG